jgi:teichuronic acid biosynthesis glycosyltransferase TuaG
MDQPLVSIILPVYQGEATLKRAVLSVLEQKEERWELLIVDNGSKDGSLKIAQNFSDERIRVFQEKRKGVSFARNLGLDEARGQYLCFLDADDRLPPKSLSARIDHFEKHPESNAVDGFVERKSQNTVWKPKSKGSVLKTLLALEDHAFTGITWMLKREQVNQLRFNTELSHCEDLYFFIEYSMKADHYSFVELPVYEVIGHEGSAMSQLESLERSYSMFISFLKQKQVGTPILKHLLNKTRRIMWRSYLKRGQISSALRVFFSSLRS